MDIQFTIYTKPGCSYCTKAKELITLHKGRYSERIIGEDISRDAFLKLIPGVKTVPQILVSAGDEVEFIGGYDDLVQWYSTT